MSELDPIQAELRRLGIKEEDETQMLLASLQKSIHTIETTYKKKIEDLEEVVRTLQDKLKEPVKLEINREERERIERIEEKLNSVEHTAQFAAHMTQRAFTPLSKTPWKTATEVSFTLIKEVLPVIPPIEPPCSTARSCFIKKVVLKKQASANGRSQTQNVVIQQSPIAK